MTNFRHGIRFENDIDAAIFGFVMAKDYADCAEFFRRIAASQGVHPDESIRDMEKTSVRYQRQGERALSLGLGLQRYELYGIDPHIANTFDAVKRTRAFIHLRALDHMPASLPLSEKLKRLHAQPAYDRGRK